MKRNSKPSAQKEIKKPSSLTPSRKSSAPEAESQSMDKLESLHFESQQVQTLVENLLVRMKQNISIQSHAKAESEMKIKKDEFAGYYNLLREGYRQIKKLTSGWEIYLEDVANRQTQALAHKNAEIEALNRKRKQDLQYFELQKKQLTESLRNEFSKREQDLVYAVNNITTSIKGSRKYFEENLTDLEVLIREQKQNIEFYSKNSSRKVPDDFEDELNKLLIVSARNRGPREQILTDRDHQSDKSRFGDFSNVISPITKNEKFHFPFKKDDPTNPLSKRSNVNNKTDISNDAFQELMGGGNNQISESRISMKKVQPLDGWDTNLEEEEDSSEDADIEKAENAFAYLSEAGIFDPELITNFGVIMQRTKDDPIQREIELNLFKEHLKLQFAKHKKMQRNMELPLSRPTSPRNNNEGKQRDRGHKENIISGQKANIKSNNKASNKQTKDDDFAAALMGVDHHISIELQSALSSERTAEQRDQEQDDLDLGDVQKEDILKADTLPMDLKFYKDKELSAQIEDIVPKRIEDPVKEIKIKPKSEDKPIPKFSKRPIDPQIELNKPEKRGLCEQTDSQRNQPKPPGRDSIPAVPVPDKPEVHMYHRRSKAINHSSINKENLKLDKEITLADIEPNQTKQSSQTNLPTNTQGSLTLGTSKKNKLHLVHCIKAPVAIPSNQFTLDADTVNKNIVHLTMFSSMNHTEPLINHADKYGFSKMVETEEESASDILNNTFPKYSKNSSHIRDLAIKIPSMATEFRNLQTNGSNIHIFSFKDGKAFTNQSSRSGNNQFYTKLKNSERSSSLKNRIVA